MKNRTEDFTKASISFMKNNLMTVDFDRGLRHNYTIPWEEGKTVKLPNNHRSFFFRTFDLEQTRPVSQEDQVNTTVRNAISALEKSGLKTHFFRVMEDDERPNTYNLTPDVTAYRVKHAEKFTKYGKLGQENLNGKQRTKNLALTSIVTAFNGFTPMNKTDEESYGPHLKAGYFRYEQNISTEPVPGAELYSKKNAVGRWLFTGQMNGCAIAIQNTLHQRESVAIASNDMNIPPAMVYHYPSPSSQPSRAGEWGEQHKLSAWFGYEGYSGAGISTDAFNAILVYNNLVRVVSQPHDRRVVLSQVRRNNGKTELVPSRQVLEHRGQVNVHFVGSSPITNPRESIEKKPTGVFGINHVDEYR